MALILYSRGNVAAPNLLIRRQHVAHGCTSVMTSAILARRDVVPCRPVHRSDSTWVALRRDRREVFFFFACDENRAPPFTHTLAIGILNDRG